MTSKQIEKKLIAAGIAITSEIEICRDEIIVGIGYTEENGYGNVNKRKTAKIGNSIAKATGLHPSYYTGYGAMVLTAAKPASLGDWNDRSSRHHY